MYCHSVVEVVVFRSVHDHLHGEEGTRGQSSATESCEEEGEEGREGEKGKEKHGYARKLTKCCTTTPSLTTASSLSHWTIIMAVYTAHTRQDAEGTHHLSVRAQSVFHIMRQRSKLSQQTLVHMYCRVLWWGVVEVMVVVGSGRGDGWWR